MACSVIGSAHQRNAKPCQDASLNCWIENQFGERLQLLTVADGHGGPCYQRSHIGSLLAVQQAHLCLLKLVNEISLADIEEWRKQLTLTLPKAIHQGWLAATQRHWRQQVETHRQKFSAVSYGSTLGLLLLAPKWWGCTGLGDWDLVGIDAKGTASLLSEEENITGSGESTASLCLSQAAELCAHRAGLHMLSSSGPQALLLSTDGVRKSCATDSDFLRLCEQVIKINNLAKLESILAQISVGGSGDDVSIAFALIDSASNAQRHIHSRKLWICFYLLLGTIIFSTAVVSGILLAAMPSRIRLANDLTIITGEELNLTENCYTKLPSNRGSLDLLFAIQKHGGPDPTPKSITISNKCLFEDQFE